MRSQPSFLSCSSSTESISCLEDLCNELIYETFQYLNYFHVYEAFFHLNIRFRHLLTHSDYPIKIDLSSLSKAAWKRYNADIIESTVNRIRVFRISDTFMYDSCLLFLFEKLSAFNRMECLILENVGFESLENLLDQLLSLSQLSSLTITAKGVLDCTKIYGQIFRLRALKYCKLCLSKRGTTQLLPICVNEYSPIEYLIITHDTDLNELYRLLSYVPHLRRASFDLIGSHENLRTDRFPFVCKQLTHISLRLLTCIEFNVFERIIRELFPRMEVLHLTPPKYFDRQYASGSKWEELITNHLPYLRIFDIQYSFHVASDSASSNADDVIRQFSTPFWIARQWSFIHEIYGGVDKENGLLYSANPYRYCSTNPIVLITPSALYFIC